MLSTPDLNRVLERVSYKPGWRIEVRDGRHEGQHVTITTVVPDAYDAGSTVTLDVHSALPPMRDERAFMDWLLWRLNRVESHECREWLRVDGKPYSDPHADGADQDL